MTKTMRADALKIFQCSLDAVDPVAAVKKFLLRNDKTVSIQGQSFSLSNFDGVYVIGFGKAAAAMAKGVESVLGDDLKQGIINVKYGHLDDVSHRIKINEAAHPMPDEAGVAGATEIINFLKQRGEGDLVFCVISGGGSAIFPLPCEGITLAEKQETTRQLLSCGADIKEINTIRKHISRVKGGQLARVAYPATLVTLILSDVIGDPLDSIASGPTVADRSSFQECQMILDKYRLAGKIPKAVETHLQKGAAGKIPDTPKEGDPSFSRTYNFIIGSNWEAVQSAQRCAENLGYHTLVLSTFIEGETKDVARVHAAIAKEIKKTGNPIAAPACIISGGETTVTLRGEGLGGRNQEFVLAAAMDIKSMTDVVMLSAGTDGTDGPTDAAGAIADGVTVFRSESMGFNALDHLQRNDAYTYFNALGDLIKTGPTNTNVMDIRLLLVK